MPNGWKKGLMCLPICVSVCMRDSEEEKEKERKRDRESEREGGFKIPMEWNNRINLEIKNQRSSGKTQ